jgi:hypothetical protein
VGNLLKGNIPVTINMPKYLLKSSLATGLGLSMPIALVDVARSQATGKSEESLPTESTAAEANRQIQKANPVNSTAVTAGNYTFVLSTPITIALIVVIGGIAIFPIVSLLLNSKKAAKLGQTNFLSKFTKRFQKPEILESDKFLYQR